MFERDIAHIVQPGQHHAGNPQRDDVAGRDEHGTWVEVVENFVR